MARVSVAMAVYNGGAFLQKQVDSVLSQLQQTDELVASYDPSTDGSWQILEDYARRDSRVRLLKNEHPGVIGNFSNALSHCTGDYIFICDQDDWWAPDKREQVVSALEAGSDLVIHNALPVDREGTPCGEDFFSGYGIRETDSFGKIFLRPRYSGCTMAMNRRMLEIVLPFPSTLDCYDQWIALLGKRYGRVGYVDSILLYHRLHGSNATPRRTRRLSVLLRARWCLLLSLAERMRREGRHNEQ